MMHKGDVLLKRQFGRLSLIYFLAQTPRLPHRDGDLLRCALAGAQARQLWSPSTTHCAAVRPFVKGSKSDFLDAQAICEAASRPSMRYVEVTFPQQQVLSALHRRHEARIAERMRCGNQIHELLLEFGIALLQGARGVHEAHALRVGHQADLPPIAWHVLEAQLQHRLQQEIDEVDHQIAVLARQDRSWLRMPVTPKVMAVHAIHQLQAINPSVAKAFPPAGFLQQSRRLDPFVARLQLAYTTFKVVYTSMARTLPPPIVGRVTRVTKQ